MKTQAYFFFVKLKPTSPNWWKLATSLPSIDLCKVNVISIDHYVSWFPFIAQIRTSWHISQDLFWTAHKNSGHNHTTTTTMMTRRHCVFSTYILWWYFDNYALTLIHMLHKTNISAGFMSDDDLVVNSDGSNG